MKNLLSATGTGKRPFRKQKGLFYIFYGLLLILILAAGEAAYILRYRDRIFPGVYAGTIPAGGLLEREAEALIRSRIDGILGRDMNFRWDGGGVNISPRVLAPEDPDLARERIFIDAEKLVHEAFAVGRNENPLRALTEQLAARFRKTVIAADVRIDAADLENELLSRARAALDLTRQAELAVSWPEDSLTPEISIIPEHSGVTIDTKDAIARARESVSILEPVFVNIAPIPDHPQITKSAAEPLIPKIEALLSRGARSLTYAKKEWPLSPRAFGELLTFTKDGGDINLSFRPDKLDQFFSRIEAEINRPPRNAKFALTDGRVTEFLPSEDGVSLHREATESAMRQNFLNDTTDEQTETVEISVVITPPEMTTAEVNTVGIQKVLGIGVSNFRGSPANRIKNIKNGARLMNGILIPPEQEFSLLSALRPFTAENGYLPELVIKGDKIEPEVGGGLCQLGTTTFRAAMKTGLEITARRNHSLVVSYYNDPSNGNPGTDATIYDPFPDFRFRNNTPGHILITSEVNEAQHELRFIFWGTSDGRSGDYSPPVVSRWSPAGPTKFIETTDLEPGKKKCQSAHPGAETSFTYTVIRPDGAKEEQVFDSRYRPLPEICLIGVEAKTDSSAEDLIEGLTPAESVDL